MVAGQLCGPFALVLLQALATDAAYIVYTIYDDDACFQVRADRRPSPIGQGPIQLDTYETWTMV